MAKRISVLLVFIFHFSFFAFVSAQTGTWHALTNLPPHANNGVCLLMTDGTVICKSTSGPDNGTGWDRLTPDAHGSYINGTWDTITPMHYDRLFFSSQVLPSGKVYVAGGEYGAGDTAGEVYDPVTNSWTMCDTIPGGWNIYDGNSEILYDGTILEGPQIGAYRSSYSILYWSPVTNKYTVGPSSLLNHDESQWLKLPDSSVLFVGIASQNTNRYLPKTATWVNDANTPGDIYDPYGSESGCAFMLPNGKAIFFGATPYNCIYTPSGNANRGTWVSADSFPVIQGSYVGQTDGSGAMLVNGHILLAVSPVGISPSQEFLTPAYFLEYDYTTNRFTQVKAAIPGQGGDSISYISGFQTQMLALPDGNVLVSVSQTDTTIDQYYIYTPGSAAIPQGKPTINNVIPVSCSYYKITGKLFNGISEGAAFGDDWQMETNYPLVRLTNGTNVYYAKTTNWNRIGAVQTDSLEDTAYFTTPAALPAGTYSLVVVVNGFASNPVVFTTFSVSVSAQNVVCRGENDGVATAIISNAASPYTYAWSPGGQSTASISGLSAGSYSVTVTANGGCTSSATVTVTQPVALSVSTTSKPDDGNSDGAAHIIASGGTSPYTYKWSPGGNTTDSVSGEKAGKYCCLVTDAHGCKDSACVTIESDAGIDNITRGTGAIIVYPNPNNGIFTIMDNSQFTINNGKESIEVYNMLGEKVYSQSSIAHSPVIIDLSNQPNGIYLYRVLSGNGNLLGEGKVLIIK